VTTPSILTSMVRDVHRETLPVVSTDTPTPAGDSGQQPAWIHHIKFGKSGQERIMALFDQFHIIVTKNDVAAPALAEQGFGPRVTVKLVFGPVVCGKEL
jgi:hypothetical protein